jgi:hypothetical protein
LDKKYESEYEPTMDRVTASFEREMLRKIRRIAGRRGVSAFLQQAARDRLAKLEELALLDELDARYGAPSDEVRHEVDVAARRHFRR